jgi:hypothetical protein
MPPHPATGHRTIGRPPMDHNHLFQRGFPLQEQVDDQHDELWFGAQ